VGLIVAGMCVQDMHLSMPAMVTATVTRARPQFLSEWNGRSPPAPRADRRSDHEGAVDTTGYGRMNGSRQGQRWGCGGFAMCPDYWKPQTKRAPGKFTDPQPRRHDFLGVQPHKQAQLAAPKKVQRQQRGAQRGLRRSY